MSILPQDQRIQATDKRGRVRVTPERRTELLNEFDRSGMTARRFAEWIGVNYQTLTGWIARRKKVAKLAVTVAHGAANGWVEAVASPQAGNLQSPGLIVKFPGEAQMEIHDPRSAALAAEVLRHWSNGAAPAC